MNKIKVLLVDDHALMRDGIRALVGVHDDIEIIGEASEGREAIEKLKELEPDIIIMDIAMPDMDGLEATRRIMKEKPKTKVLMLTQHINKEYIISAIKVGTAGYIPKRALASDLIAAIRAIYEGDSFLHPSATSTLIDDYRKRAEVDPYDRLTSREKEILKLVAEGYTSQQIADMLVISLKTVLGHRTKIMGKLDMHNRTELIKFAVRRGLISIDA